MAAYDRGRPRVFRLNNNTLFPPPKIGFYWIKDSEGNVLEEGPAWHLDSILRRRINDGVFTEEHRFVYQIARMHPIQDGGETGHPKQVLETLRRKVGQYNRYHNEFKIGITGRPPEQRWREHCLNSDNYWDGMILLYRTTHPVYAKKIETSLIERYRDYYENVNLRGGGGGPLSDDSDEYYLYILLKD